MLAASYAGTLLGDALGDVLELLAAKNEALHYCIDQLTPVQGQRDLAWTILLGPAPCTSSPGSREVRDRNRASKVQDCAMQFQREVRDGGVLAALTRHHTRVDR